MATRGFVLLEITQPEIRALLWGVQWILSGSEPRHPVHVTLRGPYRGRIDRETLDKTREALSGDTLRIGGIGRFRHPEEVVFLRVESPNLRKVCWKRDYPKKDGHEPHISLYRGRDAGFAGRVADFLEGERLELSCSDYRLRVHRSAGLDFGSSDSRAAGLGEASASFEGGSVAPQLLGRLRRFVDEYRASMPVPAIAGEERGDGAAAAAGGATWLRERR